MKSDPGLTPDLFPDGWILWQEYGAIEPERRLVDRDGTTALITGGKKTLHMHLSGRLSSWKRRDFQQKKQHKLSPFMKTSPVMFVLNI